jgi:hypothetical protein
MAARIRIRRGTSAQWAASTRALDQGELGYDTSSKLLKIGDGSTLWGNLDNLVLNVTLNSLVATETYLRTQAIATAKSEAISTASTDATTKANAAQTASATDATTKANAAQAAAISAAATDATTKANAAQSAAISTAATDATTKASSAETSANLYTDIAVASLGNTAEITYVPISDVGNIDGVASLDSTGKIPDSQIPAGIARDSEVSSAITTAINNLIDGAPVALDTLNELAAAINDDASYASTITTALGLKAPISSPTFTGTVSGIDKTMVGLANVDNTTDANKPISTATQTALDTKLNSSTASSTYAPIASPTFTGTVGGITKSMVGLGNVDNTSDANKPISTAVSSELDKKTNLLYTITPNSGSYTLLSSDLGSLIEMSNGGTLTITDSSSFPVGFAVDVLQTGSSQVTIAGDGFTPDATPGLKLRTRWSSATLVKRGLNSWVVLGDLSA